MTFVCECCGKTCLRSLDDLFVEVQHDLAMKQLRGDYAAVSETVVALEAENAALRAELGRTRVAYEAALRVGATRR